MVKRQELHPTSRHGSWLNMAKIEALERERNAAHATFRWPQEAQTGLLRRFLSNQRLTKY
jgi:hypothetical protein